MANTSGSAGFNLDLTELVEEAFERAGSEMRTGYDLRTARRSLNLLFADWANRGINMWTFEQGTITFEQGLNTYAIPTDTVDLLDHVIRTNANVASTQSDLTITRISVSTYATIPNKLTQARPIQVWYQRLDGQISPTTAQLLSSISATDTEITIATTTPGLGNLAANGFIKLDNETIYYNYISGGDTVPYTLSNCFRGQNSLAVSHTAATPVYNNNTPRVTVWPTPDGSQTYQFVYWRMRRVQDAGSGVNVMDVPFRFIPCMVAGLAYYIALKVPGGMDRLVVLKAQYDEAWMTAADEDQERAALRLVPRQMFIGGG
tara:strand:- start:1867 stop:2820 length:954 start_codon:yes stop_codon:yes gene_type:complete